MPLVFDKKNFAPNEGQCLHSVFFLYFFADGASRHFIALFKTWIIFTFFPKTIGNDMIAFYNTDSYRVIKS